jgi:hypothetical protein
MRKRKKKGKMRRRVLIFRRGFLSKGTFKKHYRGKIRHSQHSDRNDFLNPQSAIPAYRRQVHPEMALSARH